jgi:hypothetical protein
MSTGSMLALYWKRAFEDGPGADFLLVGRIHKMSTLVQWAKAEVIDLRSGQIVLDKLFTFRGDTDHAWRRAEEFISNELTTLAPSNEVNGK